MNIKINIIWAMAIAVAVLFIGIFIKKKINIFDRFCIPSPVIGGLFFSIITLIGYCTKLFYLNIDSTLQYFFMTAFFSTVGLSASLKSIKKGSSAITRLVILSAVIILVQNCLVLIIGPIFGMHPLLSICSGSMSMMGGHGAAAAWGPILEARGISGASGVALAAATFGLVIGSLIGGPIGNKLIIKNKLQNPLSGETKNGIEIKPIGKFDGLTAKNLVIILIQIAIAICLGSLLSNILQGMGLLFPDYVGALIVAVVLRNVLDFGKVGFKVPTIELSFLGNIFLMMFLTIALMTLKLWELADLAIPMFTILCAQTIFLAMFAYFVVFRALGKDYDAAVISAGTCGFGLGATPNAMANMEVLVNKYQPSPKAFLIIPIVGGMFIDVFNSLVVLILVNFFK